jgi:Domain of unknown function (DUF4865)
MIAMQYNFELPADYDMGIIERRVRDKGHLFDHTPGLHTKAFLMARRDDLHTQAKVNLYAPFYLWSESTAMVDFLCDDKFVGVTQSFGWLAVQTWSLMNMADPGEVAMAVFATRRVEPIAPFESLALLRERALESLAQAQRAGALLVVTGLDPKSWQRVLFCLWAHPGAAMTPDTVGYQVLHVSAPQRQNLPVSTGGGGLLPGIDPLSNKSCLEAMGR